MRHSELGGDGQYCMKRAPKVIVLVTRFALLGWVNDLETSYSKRFLAEYVLRGWST